MNDQAPDRSRSRAVLIGTAEYTELPPIEAAAHSLERMRQLLTGPLCGWEDNHVVTVLDEPRTGDLPDRLIGWYAQASDAALFYYVGHGQADDEEQLCLALTGSSTQAERVAATSLPFDAVRRALRASHAAVKIVILDCCFAGKAAYRPHTLAGQAGDLTDPARRGGAYILAATGAYSSAWFSQDPGTDSPHSYFTWQLADTTERGINSEPRLLTVDALYRQLRNDMAAAGKPAPVAASHDLPGGFVFARNAAWRPSTPPETHQAPGDGLDHWLQLLDEAEQAARSVAQPDQQAILLAEIAQTAAPADADRARRLLAEAERIAAGIADPDRQFDALICITEARSEEDPGKARRSLEQAGRLAAALSDKLAQMMALQRVALARLAEDPVGAERTLDAISDPELRADARELLIYDMAARDPDRAESMARSISGPRKRAEMLLTVGGIVSSWDPGRTQRVFDEAERIGRTLTGEDRNDVLASTAVSLAAGDPDRAERIAEEISDPWYEASAWIDIATRRADKDEPAITMGRLIRADDAAGEYPDDRRRSVLLGKIVRAMAPLNLPIAESIAGHIEKSNAHALWQGEALMAIVKALARDDPRRAEKVARRIVDLGMRALALTTVAMAVYADDPQDAEWLLENAERIARAGPEQQILAGMTKIAAQSDAERAEQIAHKMNNPGQALKDIIAIISVRDPERAEQIAKSISDPACKAGAIISLCENSPQRT
jgi:hypothetical protein